MIKEPIHVTFLRNYLTHELGKINKQYKIRHKRYVTNTKLN